jgi:hypothetical protein
MAGGLLAIVAALLVNQAMSRVLSFVPGNVAGFVFLASVGVLLAAGIQMRPGRESLMVLPGVLFVLAFISLLTANVGFLTFSLTAAPAMNSLFAFVGGFSLLLAVVWMSMAFTARFL